MAICLTCNGCIDNTCTECDDIVNPCATPCDEGCHQCTCSTPAYTNVRCPDHIKTDCVYWPGDDDDCVGLEQNVTTLTTIILNLIAYIKTALTERILSTDGSITVTPVDDACDDKVDLSVKIDSTTNGGDNTLTLTDDGLYVPPFDGIVTGNNAIVTTDSTSINFSGDGTSGSHLTAVAIIDDTTGGGNNTLEITSDGLYVPPFSDTDALCGLLNDVFTSDEDQQNTVDPTTYDFTVLTDNDAGCNAILISPPTGFAVSGTDRVSAFGAMEWFSTLALANTSAVAGDTVMLYADTDEDLTLKTNVNYVGIGMRVISGELTISASTVCKMSNLTFSADVVNTSSGLTCKIFTSNVSVNGTITFKGNMYWKGGIFLNNSLSLGITDSAILDSAYIERTVGINESGQLIKSRIVQTDNAAPYGVYVNNNTASTTSVMKDCEVITDQINAIMAISVGPTAKVMIQNCYGTSTTGLGAYLHVGFSEGGGSLMASNVIGRSVSSSGIQVVSSAPALDAGTTNNCEYNIVNCTGYSVSGPGISTINGNLKHCHGYSISGAGIYLAGNDTHCWNLLIQECIGDSKQGNGILLTRDAFIIGGSYTSMLDSSSGNPIKITNHRPGDTGYMIVGVTTHAFSPLAYAIKGIGGLPAIRISGCDFTCQNQLTGVLGIDPLFTLRAVSIDAYGNRR